MGEHETHRWPARPLLGAALHAALVAIPLILGTGVGIVVRDALPEGWSFGVPPWVVAGTVGMVVVWLAQPLTRRLMPLSWLLKLGMLFPGRAPTRFKIARQAGRLQELETRLARSASDTDEQAAQRSAELILALVTALTAHDRRTRGHAERTRVFTDLISEEMGLPQGDRDRLRWAALLHDIGKLEVSQRLLNKPGKPTTREWAQLRKHPEAGDQLVAPLRSWLGSWADTVLHHHERWDGGGYPAGLAGDQIALGARIVAVADVYDVMTAVRSYKRPSSAAAARTELVDCAGAQFDPSVVRAFLCIPLPRLRWALGPFAWVAQLPGVRDIAHTGAGASMGAGQVAASAPGAVGAAAAAAGLMVGSKVSPPPQVVIMDAVGSEHVDEPSFVQVQAHPDDLEAEAAIRERMAHQAARDVGDRQEAERREAAEAAEAEQAEQARESARAGESAGAGAAGGDRRAAGPPEDRPDPSRPSDDDTRDRGGPGGDPDRTGPRGSDDDGDDDRGGDDEADGGPDRVATDPTEKTDCFGGGWAAFGFGNQGQCVRFVETGKDARTAERPDTREGDRAERGGPDGDRAERDGDPGDRGERDGDRGERDGDRGERDGDRGERDGRDGR